MTHCARPAPPFLVRPTLETLLEDHAIQLALCNEIEAVADRLPDLPPLPEIRRLCDRVLRVTSTHFGRAEAVLAQLPEGQRPSPAEMGLLHHMHQLDELHAQDMVAELWRHVAHQQSGNVGQLAYMLRCYFDGCRRAIALKESWIVGGTRTPIMTD